MMTEVLQKSGLDGTFQKEVLGSLRSGWAKQRNSCLLGDADADKSFLLKGLRASFDGDCYALMKDFLQNNGLDGTFQKEILAALRSGLAKQRNSSLRGDADTGKSFLEGPSCQL